MFRPFERPMGTCSRCGKKVTNGEWIKYCKFYRVLNESVVLHFCKSCFEMEE